MPAFEQLWNKYPKKEVIKMRCQNKQSNTSSPFSNYCAINLSETLIHNGIKTSNSKAKKCWGHDGQKHILLAEEMAHWLNSQPFQWLGKCETIDPKKFQKSLAGKTGIIFFKDYWTRGNESFRNRSGDHIDPWNKDEITSSGMLFRDILELLGRVSDFNDSKEVWFWEIK